jgi:hypothetical protein
MACFVIRDYLALVLIQHSALALRAGDDPVESLF